MLSEKWRQVRRSAPCPICGKPDWCQVSADGRVAICRRITSEKPTKGGGWVHHLSSAGQGGRPVPVAAAVEFKPAPTRTDLELLARSYRTAVNPNRLAALARELGLSASSLQRLDVGWSIERRAWSFPMRDASGNVLGIRLRTPAGRKFAVAGGHEGLFIPIDCAEKIEQTGRLFVCEGPTDTAALLDLGVRGGAVGRPSCTGGVGLLTELLRTSRVGELVIFADGDRPGQQGAEALAGQARLYCASVRTISPPAGVKDARAWKQQGATAADVEQLVAAASPRRLAVKSTIKESGAMEGARL